MIKEATYYHGECDWPGCDADPLTGSEFTAWAWASSVSESADNAEWRMGKEAGTFYCLEHPVVDGEDLADGLAVVPEGPYLLIDEKGDASLVGEVAA